MVIPVIAVSVLFFRRISTLTGEQEEAEASLFTVIQENLTGTASSGPWQTGARDGEIRRKKHGEQGA